MSGVRIHVCAHDPCGSAFAASKYGHFPPPIHGKFLQVDPPTDLSSLAPAPAVADHDGAATEAIPSTAEQPTSSMEHAPTVDLPDESNAVSVELIAPTVGEAAPTVVGPTLTSELIAPTVVEPAPTVVGLSDADCPNELAAAEPSQPADSQIGGPQVSPEDDLNTCDEIAPDGGPATPCAEDDPQYVEDGSPTSPDDEAVSVAPMSPTTEILHLFDELDEKEPLCAHGGGPDHVSTVVGPAKVAEPDEIVNLDEIATLDAPTVVEPDLMVKPDDIAKPEVADVKGSADFSADAVAPASAPLATNTAPAAPAHPSSSQSRICPVIVEVVQLAEELRKSSAYCGHYVFVLFCLYYGVRMQIWTGDQCTDIVDEYIPWAAELCKVKSHINAIFCAYSVHPETGVPSLRPAGPDVPISQLNHFVATISLQTSLVSGTACDSSLESFYLPKGQCPLPTVAEGNCSMDICVQSRGQPQTPAAFQAMRGRLSEYRHGDWEDQP